MQIKICQSWSTAQPLSEMEEGDKKMSSRTQDASGAQHTPSVSKEMDKEQQSSIHNNLLTRDRVVAAFMVSYDYAYTRTLEKKIINF